MCSTSLERRVAIIQASIQNGDALKPSIVNSVQAGTIPSLHCCSCSPSGTVTNDSLATTVTLPWVCNSGKAFRVFAGTDIWMLGEKVLFPTGLPCNLLPMWKGLSFRMRPNRKVKQSKRKTEAGQYHIIIIQLTSIIIK